MARFKRTLIVEQGRDQVIGIRNLMGDHMDEVEFCYDGFAAIKLFHEFMPDLVILETILPRMDGFSVLEEIYYHDVIKIMLTWFNNKLVSKKALDLKVDYLFVKPYPQEYFAQRILEAADAHQKRIYYSGYFMDEDLFIRDKVVDYLKLLGMKPGTMGFLQTVDALVILAKDKLAIRSLKHNIYENVARKYETTPACVEKNLRYGIEKLMEKGNIKALHKLFEHVMDQERSRPSNLVFLATVAQMLFRK